MVGILREGAERAGGGMMVKIAVALLLATLALPICAAHADPVDKTKLYVTDAKACKAIEKQGVAAFDKLSFLAMSFKDGIQSYEFHCNFFDVKSMAGQDGVLVSAICETPGERHPDLLSVSPHDEKSVEVVSMYETSLAAANKDAGDGTQPAGTTIYYRCDKLSELPRE
jgi:hypothetical protein